MGAAHGMWAARGAAARARARMRPQPPCGRRAMQVIYHLNNRNEDLEFELHDAAERGAREIAGARADGAAKVDAARAQLQEALDTAKV